MRSRSTRRVYYGWYVVALCFLTLAVAFGIRYSFSVFFQALIDDFGWSRQEIAGVYSVSMVAFAAMSLPVGILLDRLGPRLLYPLGAGIFALALCLSSAVTDLWQLYVAYGLIGAFGMVVLAISSHSATLSAWFVRRRGIAIALALSGINIGPVILAPVSQHLVAVAGWRGAYLALAGVLGLVIAPLAWLVHRRGPSDLGLLPDGDATPAEAPGIHRASRFSLAPMVPGETSWTLAAAARTQTYWMLLLAAALVTFATDMVSVHLVPFLTDAGIDPYVGSIGLSVMGACSAASFVLWAWLSDRFGRKPVFMFTYSLEVIGLVMLLGVESPSQAAQSLIGVGIFGLGFGALSILQAVVGDTFRGASLGAIYGTFGLAYGVGGAVGPWLGGFSFDVMGSYRFALISAAAASALCVIMVGASGHPRTVAGMQPAAMEH